MTEEQLLTDAKEAFERVEDYERLNRDAAEDDIRFALLDEQWDAEDIKQRDKDGRPHLVINKLRPVIKQVVNDARQNSPSITVRPADSNADPETAEILSGLIRNIEQTSGADIAYDTALESAVAGGFGYFRINVDYSHDDTFDKDVVIQRIGNPFSVYGDPASTAADSSDWNSAFVVDKLTKSEFERQWKGAEAIDWDVSDYSNLTASWFDDEERVTVAEHWTREEVPRKILRLSDGSVVGEDIYLARKDLFDSLGLQVIADREVRSHKVTQRIMTGAEILNTVEWVGRYIPIVPVYGDEVNIGGQRYFRSLVRGAKDAQRMLNFWRTASTELVAMAPKSPFIGAKGSFETDQEKWASANSETWAYIEYDPVAGGQPPQRQPFAGPPAGALQEALNASDDIKAITGIYDASLGARSNETSGKAIMARQREGDVSTFNYIDNLSRSITHAGRIIIDLIPHVYSGERMIRVLGQDGEAKTVHVGQQPTGPEEQPGMEAEGANHEAAEAARVYDLTAGKYDLVVKAGPSFTTQRQEAAEQMMQLIQSFPQAAPVIGDLVAKNLDWPGAEEISERLKALLPPQLQGKDGQQVPPEVQAQLQQMQEVIQQGGQALQGLQQHLEQATQALDAAKADNAMKARELAIKEQEARTKQYEAETSRIQIGADIEIAQATTDQAVMAKASEIVAQGLAGFAGNAQSAPLG